MMLTRRLVCVCDLVRVVHLSTAVAHYAYNKHVLSGFCYSLLAHAALYIYILSYMENFTTICIFSSIILKLIFEIKQ